MWEARQRCPFREFQQWRIFYRLFPFGEERADLRIGQIGSMLYNRWSRHGSRRDPTDWIIGARKRETQTGAEIEMMLRAYAASWNAAQAKTAKKTLPNLYSE